MRVKDYDSILFNKVLEINENFKKYNKIQKN